MKKRAVVAGLLCVVIIGTILTVRHVQNKKEEARLAQEERRQGLMVSLELLETKETPIKVAKSEGNKYYEFEPDSQIAAFVEKLEAEKWELCQDQKRREIEPPYINIWLRDGCELLILNDGTVLEYDEYELDCKEMYYTSSLSVEELAEYLKDNAVYHSLGEVGITTFDH